MKISYNWLKELVNVDWSPEELGDRLTLCGTACEYIEPADEYMDKVVVGEIKAINKIEGADKIRLATVNLGEQGTRCRLWCPEYRSRPESPRCNPRSQIKRWYRNQKSKNSRY